MIECQGVRIQVMIPAKKGIADHEELYLGHEHGSISPAPRRAVPLLRCCQNYVRPVQLYCKARPCSRILSVFLIKVCVQESGWGRDGMVQKLWHAACDKGH